MLHARAAEIVAGEQQQAFDLAALDPARPTAPAVVVGSRALALWGVLEQAWYEIGFGEITNDAFRQLVLGRVIEPVSKVATIRVFTELGLEAPALRTIWRVLARRVDPQVVIGLLVDSEGFPLEIHCFEGSQPEAYTLIRVLESFKKRHQVTDMIMAADAGMLSDQNLTALEDAGFGFIVGSRPAKAPKDLAGRFQGNGAVFEPGEIIETTTVMGRGSTHRRRVVYQFSKKRWARDNKTLDLQRERAQKIVEGTSTPKKARFVEQTGQGETRLDDAGIAKARELAGLKGYVTNLSVDVLGGQEIVAVNPAVGDAEIVLEKMATKPH